MKRIHGESKAVALQYLAVNNDVNFSVSNESKSPKSKSEKRRKPSKPAKNILPHHNVTHSNATNEFNDILAKAISINQLTQSAIHAFPGL